MRSGADVVVVGGGIIGCSVAAELAAQGADVLLLERAEIAHGASGRNHGLLFYPQMHQTEPLYRASFETYRQLRDESALDISFDEKARGFIILVASDQEWDAAEREARVCAEGGVKITRLEREELLKVEPNVADHHIGGWFIEDGYRLDPAALTLSMALRARRVGAEVVTHTDVKQIIVEKSRVVGVATDEGVIEARVVVDAAGPWAPKLARSAGVDLPIIGARGWLLLTKAIPPVGNHLLESSGWHLTAGDSGPPHVTVAEYADGEHRGSQQIGLLIQQNKTGHVLLGGSRLSSMQEEPEGHEVTLEIAKRAVHAMPLLADVPIATVWSGVRPMSKDALPLIGWLSPIDGLFVAGGHGGQGIMLGAGSGKLAAQMIAAGGTGKLEGAVEFLAEPGLFDPLREAL
ncbi:MAG TPA: FAD-dependent oxidoreductase [Actinomycetota bacterium]|nr:FAD-dependent oxidoreductase [Actinomycetota bacterium]